jgi:ligand-binding sensor domain-containing protein
VRDPAPRSITRATIACIAAIATIATIAGVRTAHAQAALWNADDRITITSFNDILALAFDGRRVFAATPNGLEIYDAVARRWLPPSTVEDGYPFMEQRVSLHYERAQGGLWLLGSSGNAYLWSDLSGRWDLRPMGDGPRDRRPPPSQAESDVALRVMRGSMSLDPNGRRWRVTAIVDADRPGTYWVGTAGGNILLADSRSLSSEWLTFGTLATGVSAVSADADGNVWLGGDGRGPRDGITRAGRELQEWTSYEGFATRAPRRNVNRILAGDTVWAAAGDGLFVLPPRARSWQEIAEREGLLSNNVRSIVRTSAGVWAATARGLSLIDTETMRVVWNGMDGLGISDVVPRNDTVWIASDRGVWTGVHDSAGVRILEPPAKPADPRLGGRIAGIASVRGRIAVLAEGRLYFYDGAWSEPATIESGGSAYALRGGRTLLILRRDGLEEWDPEKNRSTHLDSGNDIPDGPVYDAARVGDHLWVATARGAVRLRLPL